MMRRRSSRSRLAGTVAVLLVAGLAVAQPHLAQRWGLYLGSPSDAGPRRLFLDPFPDLGSCEATVRVFTANAEKAYCTGRNQLEFGSAADALLAADFGSLVPKAWYCRPRPVQIIHKTE